MMTLRTLFTINIPISVFFGMTCIFIPNRLISLYGVDLTQPGVFMTQLAGAAYLIYKGHIDLKIPGSIIITSAILAIAFGRDPIFQILGGGLILGAFFMATDWVTSPITPMGKIIYGVGIGIFTFFVRTYGTRVEGMCTAILHMNVIALFIDRYTQRRYFGGGVKE